MSKVVLRGQFWVDEKGNQWSNVISQEEAVKASESLVFCTHCTDCFECSNCHFCTECVSCENLESASNQTNGRDSLPVSKSSDIYNK